MCFFGFVAEFDVVEEGVVQRHPKLHQPENARSACLKRIDRTAETREGRAAGFAERNIRPA